MPELWQLARDGDLAGVKAAIEAGANVEAKDPVRGINQQHTHTVFSVDGSFLPTTSSLAKLPTLL